jgi:hypothetical protein
LPQVIDAKGDRLDCQLEDQSRNMAAPAKRNLQLVICDLRLELDAFSGQSRQNYQLQITNHKSQGAP